jgi:mannose-6-phosphate isomerase-like protein (cupin superfamily)
MLPGSDTGTDRHLNEQINYILAGSAVVYLNGNRKAIRLRAGDIIVIPSFVQHRFKVLGSKPASFLGILSPARK